MMLHVLSAALVRVATMTAGTVLLGKVTLLLVLAWLLHATLARANPRWRVLLWRGVTVGLILLPLATLGLPEFAIRVAAPESHATESMPATAPGLPHLLATLPDRDIPVQAGALRVEAPASADSVEEPLQPFVKRPEADPATAARPFVSLLRVVVPSIWGLGVLLLGGRLALAYRRLAHLLGASQEASPEVVAEAQRISVALGCRRTVKVRYCAQCVVPFLCGLRHPVVILPKRMCQSSHRAQLPSVLVHELAHVRSRDWGWSMAVQWLSILLWFHPLVWRIVTAHRAACDAVCDAVSASYLGDVKAYCRTLASVALEAGATGATAALAMARVCDVRRRLAALERKVFSSSLGRRTVILAGVAGLLALMSLAGLRLALAEPSPKTNDSQAATSLESKPAEAPVHDNSKAGSEKAVQPSFRPMRVQVSDPEGKPVVNAGITVRGTTSVPFGPIRYRTDQEGRATIEVPAQDLADLQLLVWADDHVTVGAVWEGNGVAAHVPDEYTFTLEHGTILGGVVRDEQGKAITGAEVTVEGRKSRADGPRWVSINDTVKTDAEGKWKIHRAPKDLSGFSLDVKLRHPEFGIEHFKQEALSIDNLCDQTAVFVLRKGIILEGTVTDPQGKPLSGVVVGLFPELFGSDYPRTETDENGHYRLAVAEPGEYTLAASGKGHAPDSRRVSVAKEPRKVNLQLHKGEMIRLRVVDKDGKPMTGVRVALLLPPDKPALHLRLAEYRHSTDSDGRWSYLWLPNDQLTFFISKAGYARVQIAFAPSEHEQVVTLEAGQWSVSGRVVDRETNAPITKFRVTEGRSVGGTVGVIWYQSRPVQDQNGEFRAAWDTADDRRVICIEADGYFASKAQPLGTNEKGVTCNVELDKGQDIIGVVRSPVGKLLAEADVVLCTPSRGLYLRNGRPGLDQYPLIVRTGANGQFSFPPQRDPFLLVAMHDQGFAQVENVAGMREITLQPWARAEGTVRINDKPAVKETVKIDFGDLWSRPQGRLSLSPAEQAAQRIFNDYRAETDAEGRFVFERVRPGKATVCRYVKTSQEGMMSGWTAVNSKSVEFLPGQALTVDISGTDSTTIRQRPGGTDGKGWK